MPVFQLDSSIWFPGEEHFEEHGIVALGGDLSLKRLILAYHSGLFPWYNDDEPIIWWCPKDRMVMRPEEVHISHSLRNILNRNLFKVTADRAFAEVIDQCQQIPRKGQKGTWLNDEMKLAYMELHREGFAHSIEVWQHDKLVGGLYGVALGHIFTGESMFSKVSNGSKVAFVKLSHKLKELDFKLIDCQVYNPYLASLGAYEIPREDFLKIVEKNNLTQSIRGNWGRFFPDKK